MNRRAAVMVAMLVTGPGGSSCGDDGEPAVVLEVDFAGLQVPSELETLHFEITGDEDLRMERSYPLSAGDENASITLLEGPLVGESPLSLTVFAYLGPTVVAQSDAMEIVFRGSQVQRILIGLREL